MRLSSHAPHCTRFNTQQFSSSTTLTKDSMEGLDLTSFVATDYIESNIL